VGLDYYDPDLAECQRQNLRVARADLNQPLCFQDGQFERVFCGHVLEHVEAPVRLLREFHRILQPRGMLVLGLPVERTVQQWLGENHYFRAHEGHLYAFSVDNVRVLLQKTGFGCQRFLVEPWPGRKLQRVGLLRAALWLAQVLPLPWSLGWSNGLWVVAIKEQE
jgi:SAM-dependent methyltransferase